ncbi:MAG: ornithine aminotransferase [Citrobacter freundii]|nr:MAG: ornithine aminotransferase [Citrobacter freundii]
MTTDRQIQQGVKEELDWEPHLDTARIGVTVLNGVVTLSGEVSNYAKKLAASNAAKRVHGVKAVVEELEVGIPTSDQRTDEAIAQAVLDTIKWHCELDETRISVKVDHGAVYLEGQVEWAYQKDTAGKAVMNLVGVKQVNNYITIKPKITAGDLKDRISAALLRSATVDASGISVDIWDSKATLKGTVRSLAEKEDAEKAAWSAPGILRVDNLLTVEVPQFVATD